MFQQKIRTYCYYKNLNHLVQTFLIYIISQKIEKCFVSYHLDFLLFLAYCQSIQIYQKLKISLTNQKQHSFILSGKNFIIASNDGGGGQKVLWCMLEAIFLNKKLQNIPKVAIYSLEQNKDQILEKVKNRFAVDLNQFKNQIQIIYVSGRKLLTPQKKFTMIFHMLLPMIYCIKCLLKYQPDIFYDTTGFASTLFLTKILLPTTKTTAYVHYPFISLDMIEKVKSRKADFNNNESISSSPFKTKLKLFYYQFIFALYKINGYFVDFAQTNSSWTHNHMTQIWTNLDKKNKLNKLYPPCSVKDLLKFKKNTDSKQILMMSLAQFRPEKNHKCQINTMKKLVQDIQTKKLNLIPMLYICGTTRGQDDQQILNSLKKLTQQLNLQKYIQFQVNKPFVDILKYFERALIGIHTMESEHFGISVVQMLAGGLIVVAHNSAGPKQDIIKENEFLATTQQDYYTKILKVLQSSPQQKESIIKNNRLKAQQFGQIAFQNKFMEILENQLGLKIKSN